MSIFVPIVIGTVVGLLFLARRGSKARDIAQSLSPADRQFIADELEPITRMPLKTFADEDAWNSATREFMQRMQSRFSDVAVVVPHELYHYFHDADIHRKEPSYRAAQEARIVEFIRLLREET